MTDKKMIDSSSANNAVSKRNGLISEIPKKTWNSNNINSITFSANCEKQRFLASGRKLIFLTNENSESINKISVESNTKATIVFCDISVCSSKHEFLIELEEKASINFLMFYCGREGFVGDYNIIVKHKGISTKSNIDVRGVLFDGSVKTLRQSIDFSSGCEESVGKESENVLLYGNNISNKTVPIILCGEENVSGSHSVNAGNLDESELYYLQAKGLDLKTATAIMIEKYYSHIINELSADQTSTLRLTLRGLL